MAWIYLVASEESVKPFRPGLDQSHTVKMTDTLKLCSYHAWLGATCFQLQYGTMCEHFEEALLATPKSTSYTEASHVRTSVLLEMEKVWRETEADFFTKSQGLYMKFDLASCSWKTSQLSLSEDLEMSSENLPSWGMTLAGQLYQPKKLEPIICEDDGLCLPTPMASRCGYQSQGSGEKKYMLPQLWQMGKIPTPMARDWKAEGMKAGLKRKSPSVSTYWRETTGTIMPVSFIEWIMGYHFGATALNASATQWFRNRQEKPLKSCVV